MSPVAMMMIHNPMTVAIGDSAEMQKAIAMLDEVKESIMNAYEIKTGLTRAKISHLMDAESWFNAKKAVELGFADKILFSDDAEEAGSDQDMEAVMFSRKAVTNSLLSKLTPEKKPGTPIDLSLIHIYRTLRMRASRWSRSGRALKICLRHPRNCTSC